MLSIIEAANKIEELYPSLNYDHRKFLNYPEPYPEIQKRDSTEEYRIQYACFKYAVSSVLELDTMVEIGIRGGCSALAFLHARPNMRYLGIDNNRDGTLDCNDYLSFARGWFKKLNFKATILIGDSQEIYIFPSVDFIHIDGCHSRVCTEHDVLTSLCSDISWILIDDSNTLEVSSGIEDARLAAAAIGKTSKRVDFPNTQGGNTLLHLGEE